MSAELGMADTITEALARPLQVVCSYCKVAIGGQTGGLVSHGICTRCYDEFMTKRAQDRAYRLYLDVVRAWEKAPSAALSDLWWELLGFVQSGGGLGVSEDRYIREQYVLSPEEAEVTR